MDQASATAVGDIRPPEAECASGREGVAGALERLQLVLQLLFIAWPGTPRGGKTAEGAEPGGAAGRARAAAGAVGGGAGAAAGGVAGAAAGGVAGAAAGGVAGAAAGGGAGAAVAGGAGAAAGGGAGAAGGGGAGAAAGRGAGAAAPEGAGATSATAAAGTETAEDKAGTAGGERGGPSGAAAAAGRRGLQTPAPAGKPTTKDLAILDYEQSCWGLLLLLAALLQEAPAEAKQQLMQQPEGTLLLQLLYQALLDQDKMENNACKSSAPRLVDLPMRDVLNALGGCSSPSDRTAAAPEPFGVVQLVLQGLLLVATDRWGPEGEEQQLLKQTVGVLLREGELEG